MERPKVWRRALYLASPRRAETRRGQWRGASGRKGLIGGGMEWWSVWLGSSNLSYCLPPTQYLFRSHSKSFYAGRQVLQPWQRRFRCGFSYRSWILSILPAFSLSAAYSISWQSVTVNCSPDREHQLSAEVQSQYGRRSQKQQWLPSLWMPKMKSHCAYTRSRHSRSLNGKNRVWNKLNLQQMLKGVEGEYLGVVIGPCRVKLLCREIRNILQFVVIRTTHNGSFPL